MAFLHGPAAPPTRGLTDLTGGKYLFIYLFIYFQIV